ncbi:hypothetical protein L3X38_042142 [Prunus dulcis]|uniref:Uncharacterized protein n=1 Tax=Prunus dulcis TaxID=3755 RepID=A0AAD4YLP7_PRUDU|nr:hypothetical protein L3X38_042142 [Prunus dulcis]
MLNPKFGLDPSQGTTRHLCCRPPQRSHSLDLPPPLSTSTTNHGTFLVDLHCDFVMVRNGHNCNFGLLEWKMGNLKEDVHI